MKREKTNLLMKRKDHTEKEKELLKKIETEYNLFRYKMLLYPAEDLYNSCRMVCFYECLYEYFRYCEKINVDFINAAVKEEWILGQLWDLYLKNEYLKADTWDEIESILKAYADRKAPQAEDDNTYGQTNEADSLKEEPESHFIDSVMELSLKVNRQFVSELRKHDVISESLLKIMGYVLSERERVVKGQGIKGMVEILRDLGNDDNIISAALKKQYHLSEEEISQYL